MSDHIKSTDQYNQNGRNQQNPSPRQNDKKKKIEMIPQRNRDLFVKQEESDKTRCLNYNKNSNLKQMMYKYQHQKKSALKE